MTVGDVIDEFYKELKEEDIDRLEKSEDEYYSHFSSMFSSEDLVDYTGSTSACSVYRYEWKGLKRVTFAEYYINGEYQTRIFTSEEEFESFMAFNIGNIKNFKKENKKTKFKNIKRRAEDKVLDDIIEIVDFDFNFFWITERWEGYRLGTEIYVKVRPIPDQYSSIDNISKTRSSYVGCIDNYCLIEKLLPYQYLWNVIMHKAMLAISRDKGPGFIMDIAQIPKKQGWDVDKWFNFLDSYGIALVNSFEEDENGKRSQFNQFTQVDRSTSQSVQNYFTILSMIEQKVSQLTGITPQREGQVQQRETLGGVERSISQSVAITELYFFLHNELKGRVLQKLIDVAKIVLKDKEKLGFFTDDYTRKFIEVDENFKYADFGIFATNATSETKTLQKLTELTQIALQQQQITLADFISTAKSQSIAEIEQILKQAEAYNQQKQQQMQQQQMQMQQQAEQQALQSKVALETELQKVKAESEMQIKTADHANALELQQLKNEGSIEVAKINGEAKVMSYRMDLDADANNNGVLDLIEREKIQVEREKIEVDKQANVNDMMKTGAEMASKDKDLQMKDKELEMQDKEMKLKDKDMKLKDKDIEKAKVEASKPKVNK